MTRCKFMDEEENECITPLKYHKKGKDELGNTIVTHTMRTPWGSKKVLETIVEQPTTAEAEPATDGAEGTPEGQAETCGHIIGTYEQGVKGDEQKGTTEIDTEEKDGK